MIDDTEQNAQDKLRSYVDRIERLNEEKQTISDDIKQVYVELAGDGFDKKAVRTLIRERKKDASERVEERTILETYERALGMAE